ncbi:hypothetical protein [Microvirga solisilvae]|uniref:hypothetical protein n=1 Tax=Microvirga solisilvae TaxID=2919498 RepID=UPI001FAE9F7A|nr:hypothetical protein [Microvirga solisilvae]
MSEKMDAETVEYGLIVSFPDQSPGFTHGFEAGMLWLRMSESTEREIEITTHADNREVIQRMAASLGWSSAINPSGVEGWDYTQLVKVESKPRPELRLVVDNGGIGHV